MSNPCPTCGAVKPTAVPRTRKQVEVLAAIEGYTAEAGHPPSYAQLAQILGVSSKATIAKHIAALKRQGLIKRHKVHGLMPVAVQPSRIHAMAPDRKLRIEIDE
jgi:SOS-response transcriptional repressor LexA